jgi:hypothetical protein
MRTAPCCHVLLMMGRVLVVMGRVLVVMGCVLVVVMVCSGTA